MDKFRIKTVPENVEDPGHRQDENDTFEAAV